MANIGDVLTAPESGMQRIDDTNTNIKYSNHNWELRTIDASYYNSSMHQVNVRGAYIEFYAYTSKLYLISKMYNNRSKNINIEIDEEIVDNISLYINSTETPYCYCAYTKTFSEKKIHHVKIINNEDSYIVLDCIDIDDDGRMCTEDEYELQEAKKKLFPVRVANDTVTTEENVANYTATLTNGERQLLLLNNGDMYLSDGKGSHIKMGGSSEDSHSNREVLDLLSTDGKDLFFNGKNVQSITTGEHQAYSGTFLNVVSGQTCNINIDSGSNLCEQIVQAWEFEEGGTDLITIAKTFNNHTSENFYYEDDIEFTEDMCKIKDKYTLDNSLDETTGFYKTKFNKSDYKEIKGFEVSN